MNRIRVTLRGTPDDHVVLSKNMDEAEADEQLGLIADEIGGIGTLRLPWLTTSGGTIIAAEKIGAGRE